MDFFASEIEIMIYHVPSSQVTIHNDCKWKSALNPQALQLELFSKSQSKETESSHCVTIDFNISNRLTCQ